ncbi:uncharacterized protein LOC111699261 isoform X2 [Eurytemora carolleeae]|uniref:uncharacterized protein LOC111699261 isoform X2 n=1 Tax=Eurytemora carolleeae TaxID=1294199 RepID=UPI000C77CD66|nr:uncharacterized protein LOC111699261 isoform X2 [Eurytemora carolleeae]XP_023325650.1 uncharacterized protein LOC111699261 isoform X2 [Eurytemora carolleeae]XP_023325651.1 uncharacterized protein LOC111699261 isoform X2 [Eurytemora carolleeae]|eukprot:XP_023325649.1 uncharacterized protein LOC111699261 isoform X2 [Eurytemora affinis]
MNRTIAIHKYLLKTCILITLIILLLTLHIQVPEKNQFIKDVSNQISFSFKPQAKFVSFLPPHKIQSRNEALYIKKLENLERGVLIPPEDVYTPVPGAINLGLVIVKIDNYEGNKTLDEESFRYGFVYKVMRTMNQLLQRAGPTPIHFIIVTDVKSSSWAGRIVRTTISQRLALDIIQTRYFQWRKMPSLPPLYFSLVDSGEILKLNPGFNQGMKENLMPTDKTDKYRSDFYYIAPNYHKAFLSLDRAVFIDATDLEFTIDIKELYNEYYALDQTEAIMSLSLDLAPHYFLFLSDYRKKNPGTVFGQPGRYQGFNTGVVLYRFDRMRENEVYNSFLTREKVNFLIQKFGFQISLAEQDFFTNLGFIHPELFHILPCTFNKQESIQYNAAPFESIFNAYHDCVPKKDIKIFHLNGCGPNHKDCGQNPAPGSKFYNDTKSQFLHMDMQVFWMSQVSLATNDWKWLERYYVDELEKFRKLQT